MKTRAYSTVSHSQRCDFCMEMLLGNQFYLFPCSHGFHTDCLMQNALKSLNASQLNEIRKIEESLKSTALKLKENDPRLKAQHEALQQELDDIIAADCPLCGYTIIKQLSVSMLADIDKTEVQSWLL